jgi:hypothetical protein
MIAQLSLEGVAGKDLTGTAAVEGQDEVSELQKTIAKMQVDFTEIIEGVQTQCSTGGTGRSDSGER